MEEKACIFLLHSFIHYFKQNFAWNEMRFNFLARTGTESNKSAGESRREGCNTRVFVLHLIQFF